MAAQNGRGQDFMVELPLDVHARLQDRALLESRRRGKRIPMTEIARMGIVRELERMDKLDRDRTRPR